MEDIHPQAESDMMGISVVCKRSPHQGAGSIVVGSPVYKVSMFNVK